MKKKEFAVYTKNFIFGVEDSLVSTVGLLSGISVAGSDKSTIVLAGIVLIFVEAFSMGVGSFLSESAAEEYLRVKNSRLSVPASLIMFVSYFTAGFIPLSPYIFLENGLAFPVSILFSFVSLFILGIVSGNIFKINKLKQGVRMLVIGGIAILVGVIVGTLVQA